MAASVLDVEHFSKSAPGGTLRDITFHVEENSIMGVYGSPGAGKTLLFRALIGLIAPDAGSIRIFGMDVREREEEIRQRLGFAGNTMNFFMKRKIRDLVSATRHFFARWDEDTYNQYKNLYHIDDSRTPQELSEAMRIKLHIAIGMAHRCKLVILDDPTANLDPLTRSEMNQTFLDLRREGVSVLYTTRNVEDLEQSADFITYLRGGELVTSESKVDFVIFNRQLGIGNTLEDIITRYEKEKLNQKFSK